MKPGSVDDGFVLAGETPAARRAFVNVDGLEPDAVRVVEAIVERMRLGQARYGPLHLATDQRDLRIETAEELLDACVYTACRALRDADSEATVAALQRQVREAELAGDQETARAKVWELYQLQRARAAKTP